MVAEPRADWSLEAGWVDQPSASGRIRRCSAEPAQILAAMPASRLLYLHGRFLPIGRADGDHVHVAWLAGISGVAAVAARWVHTALAGRVDILSQALDASPDPQLILARDGRIAYANTAFHRFFPQSGEPP